MGKKLIKNQQAIEELCEARSHEVNGLKSQMRKFLLDYLKARWPIAPSDDELSGVMCAVFSRSVKGELVHYRHNDVQECLKALLLAFEQEGKIERSFSLTKDFQP
jgi:hypothetical protein